MAYLFIDSLDDPTLEAGTSGFRGTNSRTRPALIDDDKLSQGNDVIISETLMAQTRFPLKCIQNGTVTPTSGEGLFYFDTRTQEFIITGVNGTLYKVNQLVAPTFTSLSETLAGYTRFCQLNNKMYFVDGDKLREWDGSTFTNITSFYGSTSSLPKFNDIITHDNRTLLSAIDDASFDNDAIYASDLLDGQTIRSTYSVRVGGGEGDPIVKILSWHNSFIAVLKQRSCYVVNTSTALGSEGDGGQDPVNWYIEKVSDTLGCVAPKTAIVVGNDVWFLSREGLTSIIRVKESEQRQLSASVLNTEVNDVFEDINWGYVDTACAGFFNNRYYLSIPIETSQVPNVTLVFNLLTQSWEGKFTGTAWKPSTFARASFGSNRHLIIQDTSGNLFWQREEGGVYESRDELPRTKQTSGTLTVGQAYLISDYNAGDNFSNVGASSNATGIQFIATATTPTTYTNGSTLEKYIYEDIDLNVITKAWDFGYPINFKSGFNLEIDFYKSHGNVDIYLIPDDDETRKLTVDTGVQTSYNPVLPETLPYTLSGKLDKRVIYHIRDIEEFKELKCQIIGNASEVKVRRIHITSFLNTMEIDNSV